MGVDKQTKTIMELASELIKVAPEKRELVDKLLNQAGIVKLQKPERKQGIPFGKPSRK